METDSQTYRDPAAALRASEERYRTLTAELQVGVLIQGPNAEILLSNPKALELLGLTEDQLLGRTSFDPSWNVIHEDGSPFAGPTHPVPRAIASRQAVMDVVMGVYRPATADRVWLLVNAHPQLKPDGGVAQIVCTFADITARKQTELRLKAQEAWLRAIFEGSPVGIVRSDTDGRLLDANPAFLRMVGFELGELAGRPIFPTLGHPDDLLAMLAKREAVLEGRRPRIEGELRWVRKDGATIWVSVDVQRVTGASGTSFHFGIIEDITERKQAEDALRELNATLEDRVRAAIADARAKDQLLIAQNRHAAMGEMIGNIAHQWRQPLTALGMLLTNLRDSAKYGELDGPRLEKETADADRLIRSMSSTISDFRNFFQPDKARAPFQVLAQVDATLGLLAASFRDAGVSVEIDAPQDLRLFGVANEYCQVLINLLTNARQAIQLSQIAQGKVTLRLCERDGLACLAVRDNGGGVPPHLLDRVGEPYFTTKEAGTGLGMYLSRQIVERSLGGRLEVRNVAGGAEVTILTPLAPPTAGVAPGSA